MQIGPNNATGEVYWLYVPFSRSFDPILSIEEVTLLDRLNQWRSQVTARESHDINRVLGRFLGGRSWARGVIEGMASLV
jgi:hypothetical protein